MTDAMRLDPVDGEIHATVSVPGSKSLTNRALLAAALADGTSWLAGALRSDDTEAMATAVEALGATVRWTADGAEVDGTAGAIRSGPLTIDVAQAGTVARFVPPVLVAGRGQYRIVGDPQIERRPMGPMLAALAGLGAKVASDTDGIPFDMTVNGDPADRVGVDGTASSQFLSGLLMAGAVYPAGLEVSVEGDLVSEPYVDMTSHVMAGFGAHVEPLAAGIRRVRPGGYRAARFPIEPDASSATYFWAAGALAGEVTVAGLDDSSVQGDRRFVDVMAAMGASVTTNPGGTTVGRGPGGLVGVDVDLGDLSDTMPTVAAVAALAEGTTRIRGVGFVRGKESDRIAAMATELARCGVDVTEHPDGLDVVGLRADRWRPATIDTYRDHRIAMAFGVVALRVPGIAISDPGCVAKTFPDFFERLASLR